MFDVLSNDIWIKYNNYKLIKKKYYIIVHIQKKYVCILLYAYGCILLYTNIYLYIPCALLESNHL